MNPVTVYLESSSFERKETTLAQCGAVRASVFRYSSGVCGLRLSNAHGNLVVLPYQGQQIWSMAFDGQSLTMRSMFDEPRPTTDFLSTYGGFMLHCGMLSMGNPGPGDTHPIHGELPNAPYQTAFIRIGADEQGTYVEAGGSYRHAVAFTSDYVAEPLIRLYDNGTTAHMTMKVTNLKAVAMEYMYLAHINFRPIDGARLVYTAPCGADRVEVYREAVEPFVPDAAHSAFMDRLSQQPGLLDRLDFGHPLDPEVVMFFDYVADGEGWAHSLHIQPDGYAGYVKHRPDQLDKVLRWIVRTDSEEALGLALPATAAHRGYAREKREGHVRLLPGGASVVFDMEAGLLRPPEAERMEQRIQRVMELASV